MKYDEENKEYILSNGFLSNGLEVFPLRNDNSCNRLDPPKVELLCKRGLFREPTPEERKEIAEYMIELWKEWAK